MRSVVLALCLSVTACTGQVPDVPTSPTGSAAGTLEARRASNLPMHGSFTFVSSGSVNCPPTCPPTTLRIQADLEGTAAHLGRFTATLDNAVDMATTTSKGSTDFRAANGDRLTTTTTGAETAFVPPNESHVHEVATITGGTGRFANASGTLVLDYVYFIDFQANTAEGSGTLEGRINLRH